MSEISPENPTSWIKKFWPISRFELKKVLPILFLKFLISYNYAILTSMKDTIVVTAKNSGAEVIPVIKGWVVFPLAICIALLYSKLSNHYKRSTIFYATISAFLLFLFVYAFFLYPNADSLTPHESSDWLVQRFGENYSHWIAIYRNWMHTLFFVTAEMWAQVVIFILFWGFINEINKIGEAKRTYTIFIAAGDLGSVLTGPLVWYYVTKYQGLGYTPTLQAMITYVIFFGIAIMGIYYWINRYVLTDKRYYDPEEAGRTINTKTKLTLIQGLKHICKSKYLLSIAILVIGCGLTINVVEVTWKAYLKMYYPTAEEYQKFVAMMASIVGVIALLTVFFLGGNLLRKFGWFLSSMITPIVVGVTGVAFFALSLFYDKLSNVNLIFQLSPLALIVILGAVQNVLSKVTKYSFFDSTKEMAYIPLDPESKTKGKASIDVVGSRLGKSSSSWLQIALIEFVGIGGSVLSITSYLIPILVGMIAYWIVSVRYINRKLEQGEVAIDQTPVKA